MLAANPVTLVVDELPVKPVNPAVVGDAVMVQAVVGNPLNAILPIAALQVG